MPHALSALFPRSDNYKDALDEFWTPNGPKKLVFVYQVRATEAARQPVVARADSCPVMCLTLTGLTTSAPAHAATGEHAAERPDGC